MGEMYAALISLHGRTFVGQVVAVNKRQFIQSEKWEKNNPIPRPGNIFPHFGY